MGAGRSSIRSLIINLRNLAWVLAFLLVFSPVVIAAQETPTPETPETSSTTAETTPDDYYIPVFLFADESGGVLGVSPLAEDLFVWTYATTTDGALVGFTNPQDPEFDDTVSIESENQPITLLGVILVPLDSNGEPSEDFPDSGAGVVQRKFTGHEFDRATSLTYANARYYKQNVGRFLSQDPVFWGLNQNLQNPQSLNSYSYAENNPIVKNDPTGRCPQCLIGAGAGILGQYGYDVYRNISSNGLSASAFYSNLSSPQTYAVSAIQGGVIAATGGLVGAAGLGLISQAGIVGGTSGLVGVLGNVYLGEPITTQSVSVDTVIGGVTFGLAGAVPKLPGRLPNFGTQAFYMGKHAQQSAMHLGIESVSNYTSQLTGNFDFGDTYKSRRTAVQNYNTSAGAILNESKLWTMPSGAVVTWGGDLVIGPTAQSTPEVIKK